VPRRRRLRLVLALVGGALAVLCLGGGGIAYVLYDRATAPDRSNPEVTVTNYLQAMLMQRDHTRAGLYACDNASNLTSVDALLTEIVDQERRLGVGISVNIENVRLDQSAGSSASVVADIRRSATVDRVLQSISDTWRFQVVKSNGWRVCGAQKSAAGP
jgi:hypothetical protein